jgi:zinc protease
LNRQIFDSFHNHSHKKVAPLRNRFFLVGIFIYFLLLVAGRLLIDKAGAAELTPSHLTVLPNGMRVLVKSEHGLGVVAINLVIHTGSAQDDANAPGAAHFLEHLAFRGSAQYKPGEVNALIENAGGTVNAGTLRDFTHFYATVPAKAFAATLAALADATLNPNLDNQEIERERGIIQKELLRQQEDPRTAMWDIAHHALFGDAPYGRPVGGFPQALGQVTRDKIVTYHHHWYVPNNISLIIVGDIGEAEALQAARTTFGNFVPGPAKLPEDVDPKGSPNGREETYYHNGSMIFVGLAVKGAPVAHAGEVCTLDVLLSLLGDGSNSRLQAMLQDANARASRAGAEFLTGRAPAPFLIWATCKPDQLAAVKAGIEKELRAIADGEVPPAEIQAAKRRVETSYWFNNETYTDQADMLGFYDAIDSYRFADDYIKRIHAVTPEMVRNAARSYFASSARVWLEFLPRPAPNDNSSEQAHAAASKQSIAARKPTY